MPMGIGVAPEQTSDWQFLRTRRNPGGREMQKNAKFMKKWKTRRGRKHENPPTVYPTQERVRDPEAELCIIWNLTRCFQCGLVFNGPAKNTPGSI